MADDQTTKLTIHVKLPEPKEEKKDEKKDRRQDEWPWRLFRPDDPSTPRLEIEFYDAMTFLNPQTNEFELDPMYVSQEAEYSDVVANGRGRQIGFLHNKLNQPTPEQIEKHYLGNSIPYSDKAALGRMPDSYFEAEKVLPVGVHFPNLKVTLKNTAGDIIDETDYLSYLDGTSKGTVADHDILTYDWLSPQFDMGDLKVEEKTSASIVCHARGNKRLVEGQWDGSIIRRGVNDILEGIFWNTFDTSDTTNFKVTTVPKYDCDEEDVYQLGVVQPRGQTKMKVFLTKKRCHFWARFDHGGVENNYGLFTHWPDEFDMPRPRKRGRWQLTAPYNEASYDRFFGVSYSEESMRATWEWRDSDKSADCNELNGLYILNILSRIGIFNTGWRSYRAQDPENMPFNQRIFTARSGIDSVITSGGGTSVLFHGWTTPYLPVILPNGMSA
jgi:hypothetical protein